METANEIHGSIWTHLSVVQVILLLQFNPDGHVNARWSTYRGTKNIFFINNMTGDLVCKDQITLLYT